MISARTVTALREEYMKLAEDDRDKQLSRAAIGGVGSSVAGTAGALGMMGMGTRHVDEDASLAKKMREAVKELPIETVSSENPMENLNAYYHPGGKLPIVGGEVPEHIAIGKYLEHSPGVLGHELGHYELTKSRGGRLLQNPVTTLAGKGAIPIGLATGALTANSDNENVRRLGRWAPMLTTAPQLAYEGLASIKGLKRMKAHGASRGQLLRAAGTMLPAWGTYAANAGVGTAAAHGMQALQDHRPQPTEE